MALIQSASGTRIDCDTCEDYAAAPSVSVEVLRRATGDVSHGARDFCSMCWEQSRRRSSRPKRKSPLAVASRRVITVQESID